MHIYIYNYYTISFNNFTILIIRLLICSIQLLDKFYTIKLLVIFYLSKHKNEERGKIIKSRVGTRVELGRAIAPWQPNFSRVKGVFPM